MTPRTFRTILRSAHIAIGLFIGAYIYSPWHADPNWTLAARLALIPLITLTGVAMWKQGRLTALFGRNPR
ncbi:MAG: hypothetical protein MEP57_06035 [Microvirga sp.]|nr:hypothetical protein [Microvirga sp.]